ncbi:MAG: glycoside hydrolase family 88 protein [Ignavibacteriaceae bacterium]
MNKFFFLTCIIFSMLLSGNTAAGEKPDSLVNNAVKVSLIHLERSVKEVGSDTLYPAYGTKDLRWQLKGSADWTSGFYPGCLWYAYELSDDIRFENWAREWTVSIEDEKYNPDTHDLGFRFMCSYGNGLRFGSEIDRKKYKDIILSAAETLAKRYNPEVGCLSSNWDIKKIKDSFPVVIDIMMNLEILFWASENGGPQYLAEYALKHAATTARDFIRADGGTYHIVRYNKYTGKIINKGTLQGAGNETTWSRGQAWGIYGFVVAYRYTKEKKFLKAAEKLADYFIKHLPGDHVAPWDFQSDIHYRDVSATSITASALLEMIKYINDDSLRSYYKNQADEMLGSLCKPPYFTDGKNTSCILDHSVQFLPENSNVDVPAIFADYYFLEAIYRYKNLQKRYKNTFH